MSLTDAGHHFSGRVAVGTAAPRQPNRRQRIQQILRHLCVPLFETTSEFHLTTNLRLTPIVVLILVISGADIVQALDTVCSDTPASDKRVFCQELDDSTDNINIDLDGVMIHTTGEGEWSVAGVHRGMADINIDVQDSSLTTTGTTASSIHGLHLGTGDIDIDVQDLTSTTTGGEGFSVFGWQLGTGGDINIDVRGSTLTTTGGEGHSVFGVQSGTGGDINIDVRGSTLTTEGASAYGIIGKTTPSGYIDIDVFDGTTILTKGDRSHSVIGWHEMNTDQQGYVDINVQGGSLTTEGLHAYGLYGLHQGMGDVQITATGNNTITTKGNASHGIFGWQYAGMGNVFIDLIDSSIMVNGEVEDSISIPYGIYGRVNAGGDGDVDIHVVNSTITTMEDRATGVIGAQLGGGRMIINIDKGSTVTANGANAYGVQTGRVRNDAVERSAEVGEDGYRQQTVTVNGRVTGREAGVYLAGGGRVIIESQGVINSGSGIAILATGDTPGDPVIKPKLRVDMNLGGRRVEQALGDNWIINDGGETTIAVNRTVLHDGATGVTGRTAANGAWNVMMREHGVTIDDRADPDPANWMITESTDSAPIIADRDFSTQDFTETRRPRPPPPVPPVPVLQVYMVEEPIIGRADDVAGIHVEGDGIVYIGPMGSIRAESGIAILATQDTSGPLSNSSPEGLLFGDVIGGGVDLRSTGAVSEIATLTTGDGPRLTVDMDLDGRRVQDVIGDDWIINDQGETTIIVNGVTLHEGATGIVTDAVAPNGPFNVAMIGEGVMVTDRTDPDPANWIISDPTLGIIADRDFSAEDFLYLPTSGGSPMFIEEYAPRAALYEVLPDFMLRMQKWEPTRQRLFLPESPVYIRLLGSTGSQEFKHSTVNANYDADRSAVEAGVNIPLFENLDIWASMHHVTGSADVDSPVDGGDIRVTGAGLSVDAYWSSENDYYATGRLSLTDYDIDLSSNTIGRLKSNGDANGQSVHVEAGRRMALSENLHWTPRAWLGHTRISVDQFTDAVDSRVSFSNTDRFTGGLGVMVESVRTEYGGGELLLRGSLDFEQKFGDSKTVTLVSGERLSAEPEKSSALMSLSGTWKKGPFKFSAELSARQDFNSGGEDYSGTINLGMNF